MRKKNFWNDLPKPFYCLAPMADVTDAAFRELIARYSRHGQEGGGPDVFWTEFVSADGLCSVGRENLLLDFKHTKDEHPIVAQIFGSNPDHIEKASSIASELGFDGIDINMGCPDKSIEKQGAGAAHMKDPKRAREIIRAAIEGARGLPVSVKTRLGYNKNEIETWIPEIISEDISALTIHGRTRKEMSKVPARWEDISRVAEIVRQSGKDILVIGNGDVENLRDAKQKAEKYKVDGVMLGRAIFGNPWLFDQNIPPNSIGVSEKLNVLVEHTKLFEKLFTGKKNFSIMKKHYKAYVNGFDGAKDLRMELMEKENAKEVEIAVSNFLLDKNTDK